MNQIWYRAQAYHHVECAELTQHEKLESVSCHQLNVGNKSVFFSGTIIDIWTRFSIRLKHQTTKTSECVKFTWIFGKRQYPDWMKIPALEV